MCCAGVLAELALHDAEIARDVVGLLQLPRLLELRLGLGEAAGVEGRRGLVEEVVGAILRLGGRRGSAALTSRRAREGLAADEHQRAGEEK